MRIIQYEEITDIKAECENIYQECCRRDKYRYTLFLDDEDELFPKQTKVYCAMEGARMQGFLSLFMDDENTAEICLFVAPGYRKQGVATALLKAMTQNINLDNVLVPVAKQSSIAFCNKLKLTHEYDELVLELKDTSLNDSQPAKNISENELEIYYEEDEQEFVMEYDGEYACSTNIIEDNDRVWFFNVITEEAMRNRGLATYMIKSIMSYYPSNTIFAIQVNSKNLPAMRLYEKLGFEPVDRVEYYRV